MGEFDFEKLDREVDDLLADVKGLLDEPEEDEAELDDVFAEADNEVKTTVDNIEDLLLSRQPENLDNYTLAVIFVNKVYQNPEKRKRIKNCLSCST